MTFYQEQERQKRANALRKQMQTASDLSTLREALLEMLDWFTQHTHSLDESTEAGSRHERETEGPTP